MHIYEILYNCTECAVDENGNILSEAVTRQFRRFGTVYKRQYRCIGGQKDGRLVTSPQKCGIRKDPKRVRQGKRTARIKKQIRIRKTLFTKRKTHSKMVKRKNLALKGFMTK